MKTTYQIFHTALIMGGGVTRSGNCLLPISDHFGHQTKKILRTLKIELKDEFDSKDEAITWYFNTIEIILKYVKEFNESHKGFFDENYNDLFYPKEIYVIEKYTK